MARDDYDRLLYRNASFLDLPDSPVLYVNAVDVVSGERFVFSKFGIREINCLNEADPLHAADLVGNFVDPDSVRIADAVYASSAFPFAYPNLPMFSYYGKLGANVWGMVEHPSIRFLGDGGILDNSGLLTLITQMHAAFSFSRSPALVLAILIDAERHLKTSRLGFAAQDREAASDYAWNNTYLRQGLASTEVLANRVQKSVYQYLVEWKLLWDVAQLGGKIQTVQFQSFDTFLSRTSERLWRGIYTDQGPLLPPALIWLRLSDVPEVLLSLLEAEKPSADFVRRLEANALSKAVTEGTCKPKEYCDLVATQLSEIETDFKLAPFQRSLLDLAAYALVHGYLKPALAKWAKNATNNRPQMRAAVGKISDYLSKEFPEAKVIERHRHEESDHTWIIFDSHCGLRAKALSVSFEFLADTATADIDGKLTQWAIAAVLRETTSQGVIITKNGLTTESAETLTPRKKFDI